jgi:hypothetical protein
MRGEASLKIGGGVLVKLRERVDGWKDTRFL